MFGVGGARDRDRDRDPRETEQEHFPSANPTAQRENSNNNQSGILGSLSVLHTLLAQRGLKAAQADCLDRLHCAFLQSSVRVRYDLYGLVNRKGYVFFLDLSLL